MVLNTRFTSQQMSVTWHHDQRNNTRSWWRIFLKKGESIILVQCAFCKKINMAPHKPAPSWNTILRWVHNFRNLISTTNKKCTGLLKSVRIATNIEAVCETIEKNPTRSVRKDAQALHLTWETTCHIIRLDRHKHPYKIKMT